MDFESGDHQKAVRQLELFGIDPVEAAVAEGLGAVGGQRRFFLRGDVDGVQVPASAKSHHLRHPAKAAGPVRDRGFGELVPFAGIDVNQKQIATEDS